jgi:hypothetical protein
MLGGLTSVQVVELEELLASCGASLGSSGPRRGEPKNLLRGKKAQLSLKSAV